MKRLIIVLFTLSLCAFMSAQDIIVKSDGTRIDAVVQTIGEIEISYKKFDDQEGPTCTVLKSDVVTIVYKNGKVETFEVKQNASEDSKGNEQSVNVSGTDLKQIPSFPFSPTPELKEFCPQSYHYLQQWNTCRWIGIPCLVIGVTGCLVGGLIISKNPTAGAVLLGVGVPCAVAVIPLVCVSSYKKKKAKEVYNNCVDSYTTSDNLNGFSLNIQGSSDGIGIAVRF